MRMFDQDRFKVKVIVQGETLFDNFDCIRVGSIALDGLVIF